MNGLKDMKLLRGLVRSQERKKFYSTNTNKILNAYKCPEHNEYFTKICLNCNLDICLRCEKNYHYKHQTVNYEEINPDYNEIENLKKKINIYIDNYNNIRKEINTWYNELKNKIYDFELSIKNNEIINSMDFIINYPKNKISLNSILKFRKIYYNIMEDYNIKNNKIISIINQYGNSYNINLPLYYDFLEIKNLSQELNQNGINYNKNNFIKKGELILNYISKIPYIENVENNNNVILSKNSSFNNLVKNPFVSPNYLKNSDLCDKSTGNKYSNENYKTYSEKGIFDSKINAFKNIINKTKIEEFNLNSSYQNEQNNTNKLNKTFNLSENRNYSITDFTKYLNKMGYLNTQENDLHRVNSSQDLLNKSSLSIKSTKYTPYSNNSSNFNLINNINNKQITKSPVVSYKNNNNLSINSIKKDNVEKNNLQNKKLSLFNNALYMNKNTQAKTYVHKKFNNNISNINKLNDNNIKKNNFIKFQKKINIINKSNRDNNNNSNIQNIKNEEISQKTNNNENKDLIIGSNYIKSKENKTITNTYILSQKIVREKQINDDILNDNETENDNKNKEKIYSSPIKPDLFKNAIISDEKEKIIHDYDNDNEESNINTTDKKNILHIIYSPSNKNPSTNKKNQTNINNGLNFQTYKTNNSTNLNYNPPNIIKTNKNSSFFVDPEKELCIGLELGNTECKVGLVNQNTSEIQLICFEEEKYSLPTVVSFGLNKKEIKIGYEAEKDILNNPSQTIFNIIKLFSEKNIDVKGKTELWPFRIYFTNDEENRPYIKINFGPQKDKIFYFENILSIFLQKMFEIIFNKINLENSSKYNTQEKIKNDDGEDYSSNNNITLNTVLVLTIPNYFTYYQRKLIENIIKTEIFPDINNGNIKVYGKYKINLIGIKIENASSIGAICLNTNYDFNNNNNKSKSKNILILNIDGGSSNVSITSILNENEKQIYQVKAINSISKGENDLIDDFIYYVLQKFNEKIKKEILESSLALSKLRKLCKKLRYNLIQKEKDKFNIVEVLENYDEKIEISKNEYENSTINFFNEIKSLINETLYEIKIKEKDINDIIFIGELCREKNITQIIEQIFRQDNTLYEELIYSNYMDNEKDFYIVGGAAYHALHYINNNMYYYFDISPFNIGIKNYNEDLNYIITKGEKIPLLNENTIKIDNENELKLYERYGNDNKSDKLIGKIELNNDIINTIMDLNENNIKYGYRELKIEYEINDKLEIFISIFNGEKYGDKIKVNLFYDNFSN